ncbi:MAG: bis(5'-nucleosyl)-tetraphosphatase (symmetrical) [Deltaproteobacteria bacterium RIFCSPLOWO2_12_FULL_40_28]|nr:MAG: bis(5'-nucleosyl)-tetraphosphatase (symmetrical) [Deltaproteobacteria bacterium RIFCSPHIGHO2_02_FULL_40_28]OGQ19979.1 MAG: bis(5'-nucleosyl)-tetraphosphatase (symmetrical) [Deltaproteobacteria bacterium RIFCSPHIGHO2_12_FULL_40_32]OGQ39739.1 MAG: bis(5'-nucleosyl)-tetraphosphatase (symmetrical) [Deltaproteobacteria bacterium RIFCSPLOWO2_02_FULL_40_36]OGQ52994.1 MAG: bis(5'-nucleosyl)-tetraphosphatase (symmetrical) [Deltaproteobacteria bacterium RIFCSPLOWO2_12_FULL_40_28]
MATYVVGDIQGCFKTFKKLLSHVSFNPKKDRLWLVGDLVNRGPHSLEVLRFAAHQKKLVSVIGNHDLYCLARYFGLLKPEELDTLGPLLKANNRTLINWLRTRPLMHEEKGFILVHAGLHPSWSLADARKYARVLEKILRSKKAPEFLEMVYSKRIDAPQKIKNSNDELNFALGVFTRMRVINKKGQLHFKYKGPPDEAPAPFKPWFEIAKRKTAHQTILFGHWAHLGHIKRKYLVSLDTACVWGVKLTAYRLEDGKVFQVHYCDG